MGGLTEGDIEGERLVEGETERLVEGDLEGDNEEETSFISTKTFISLNPKKPKNEAIFEPVPVKDIALVKVISAVLAFSRLLTSML